jgi:hypothetical protein
LASISSSRRREGLVRGLQRDAALVERLAHDRLVHAERLERRQANQVGGVGHAARGRDLELGAPAERLDRREVRALERAVAAHVGELHAPHAPALDRGRQVERVHVGRLRPPGDGHAPVLRVDRHRDRVRAQLLDRRPHHVGTCHGCRPEDHALGAVGSNRQRVLERAHPTADLDRDANGAHDARNGRGLSRAVHRGVEIHEVDPLGTLGLEAPRDLGGIDGVDRLLLRAPLVQAHDAALAQVDRGHDDHAALRAATAATKFATRRWPTSWLFSGWNCRPSTGPRPTIAAKSCP